MVNETVSKWYEECSLTVQEQLPKLTSEQISILENALHRYKHFIGICEGEFPSSEIALDRQNYPHLFKETQDGEPIFDDELAVEYIALMTGFSPDQCAYIVALDCIELVEAGLLG